MRDSESIDTVIINIFRLCIDMSVPTVFTGLFDGVQGFGVLIEKTFQVFFLAAFDEPGLISFTLNPLPPLSFKGGFRGLSILVLLIVFDEMTQFLSSGFAPILQDLQLSLYRSVFNRTPECFVKGSVYTIIDIPSFLPSLQPPLLPARFVNE